MTIVSRRIASRPVLSAVLFWLMAGSLAPVWPQFDFGNAGGTGEFPPRGEARDPSGERVASRGLPNSKGTPTYLSPADADVEILQQLSQAFRRVVERMQPAVVHIEADKAANSYASEPTTEAGSGVIVVLQNQSCVLTNYHVIRDAKETDIHIVLSDGRRLHPVRILWDDASDVAVLMLPESSLPSIAIGDSREVAIGDVVLAFGSPFGLSQSVSHGIVSAKGRRNLELGIGTIRIQDFIQTDAAINPGNSGGPLLNARGELIGLNTAIASNSGGNEGIAFSIPVNLAIPIAEQLIRGGRVVRPYLGVQLDREWNPFVRGSGEIVQQGAKVTHVAAESPAERAGLLVGDVITRFDHQDVEDDGHLMTLVGMMEAGACHVTVMRNGKNVDLSIPLQPRGSQSSPPGRLP